MSVVELIAAHWIGHELPVTEFAVERGRLRSFAKAIGETDPVYTELATARAAGYADLPAPPTFLFSAELDSNVVFSMLEMLGVELDRILHGEQSFDYLRPVVAGDTVTVHSQIAEIYARKAGALQFVVTESVVRNQHKHEAARMRSVIVVRN